jgi:hypothetical protein
MKGKKPNYNLETITELIKQGYTLKMLGEKYKVASSSVGRALRKIGLPYNLQVRKISKNEDFFEEINSELKAYLLGFFVADGCIYDKSRFGLCIAEQDSWIVDLFKNSIAPDSLVKITHNTKGAKNRQKQLFLRISSEKIVMSLSKYGVKPRKTWSAIKVPCLSESLKWHFIRGYFDGDGHLGIRKAKYNTCRINFCNGDKTILEDIQNFTGLGRLYQPKNKKYWKLDIENIINCKTFLDSMYYNSVYKLPRKFKKYQLVNAEVFAVSKKTADSVTHRD